MGRTTAAIQTRQLRSEVGLFPGEEEAALDMDIMMYAGENAVTASTPETSACTTDIDEEWKMAEQLSKCALLTLIPLSAASKQPCCLGCSGLLWKYHRRRIRIGLY